MGFERRLHDAVAASPIATVLTDPNQTDNPIVAVNQAFCDLTLYPRDEIVGRNCRFLAGPETEVWNTQQLREAIEQRKPILTEILNYRRDGSVFRNAVMIAPVFGPSGELEYFLGSQMDVGEGAGSPEVVRRQRAAALVKTLSPRQLQILTEMAAGYRNKQIAWRLSLSEKTVKMHRALMLEKLGAASSADAVRIAVEAGL